MPDALDLLADQLDAALPWAAVSSPDVAVQGPMGASPTLRVEHHDWDLTAASEALLASTSPNTPVLRRELGSAAPPRSDQTLQIIANLLSLGAGALLRSLRNQVEAVYGQQPMEAEWRYAVRLCVGLLPMVAEQAAHKNAEAAIFLPFAERTMFLLLSAPFRLSELADLRTSREGPTDHSLAFDARLARDRWAARMLTYESDPVMRGVTAEEIEADSLLLTLNGDKGPIDIRADPAQETSPKRTDTLLATQIQRDVLLPRFAIREAGQIERAYTRRRRHRLSLLPSVLWAVMAGTLLLLLVLSRTTSLPLGWGPNLLAGLGVAAYASIACSMYAGPLAMSLLCLRMAAGTALGITAFLALPLRVPFDPPTWLGVTLLLLPFAYLAVEALNHGTSGKLAFCRVLRVGALGVCQALSLAAPIVIWGAPQLLTGWQVLVEPAQLCRQLMAVAGGGLVFSTFLQVLWDDRPITYPLGHLEWRG